MGSGGTEPPGVRREASSLTHAEQGWLSTAAAQLVDRMGSLGKI